MLLLVAGCRKEEPGGSGSPTLPPASAGSGSVRLVEAVADGGHRRVRIVGVVRNAGSTRLEVQPPAVQLWAAGKAVPQFIAPGLVPVTVAPGETMEAETFWWLPEAEAVGALEFEVLGTRSRVNIP
jgi:hypothetical protein